MSIVSWLRQLKYSTPSKVSIRDAGMMYSFINSDLANNETIFAAITILANSMASLPVTLRRDYDKVVPSEHSVARLLAYGPNNYMTTFEFIRLMEVLRNVKGRAYAIKEYDTYYGDVSAIYVLDSDYVTPIIDKDTKELYYRVSVSDGDTYFHNSHIISVGHISTDGMNSLSPIDVLRNTLNYDREIKEISINQLKNGMHCNLAFKLKGHLGEPELEEYCNRIKKFRELGVLFLDSGKEIQELQNGQLLDPRVFEVEKITVSRVSRVFNIPQHKLNSDVQSYSSSEQGDLEYITDTMLPLVRMYEQEFCKKLLPLNERDTGLEIKFNLNGLARADMNTRGNFYFKMIRSAGMTPNEMRSLEDMAPKPGGDDLMISRDLIRLKDLPLLLNQTGVAKGGEEIGQ